MLYSGADLIRTSSALHERMERLQSADAVKAVAPPENPTSNLDEQSQGAALLRFARFVNKEGKKKQASKPSQVKANGANPYLGADNHAEKLFGRGQTLDVYI